MTGHGIYCDEEGNIYEGDFLNGNFHGYGQLTYSNGDVYIGSFFKNKKEGKGILKKGYNNNNDNNNSNEIVKKEIYDGNFKNDFKSGDGILIIDDCKYEGIFENDILIKGKMYKNDNTIVEINI